MNLIDDYCEFCGENPEGCPDCPYLKQFKEIQNESNQHDRGIGNQPV
jgi:hypothetical protein